jgi:hypothetical protein
LQPLDEKENKKLEARLPQLATQVTMIEIKQIKNSKLKNK